MLTEGDKATQRVGQFRTQTVGPVKGQVPNPSMAQLDIRKLGAQSRQGAGRVPGRAAVVALGRKKIPGRGKRQGRTAFEKALVDLAGKVAHSHPTGLPAKGPTS